MTGHTLPGPARGQGHPTVVLVPGSWLGRWCWSDVQRRLADSGVDVYALTLSGLSDRASDRSPSTGLESHIADVTGFLRSRSLSDVVLVGHSYAGMVVTGAFARERGLIRTLVYVDGFVPETGMSCFDAGPGLEGRLTALRIPGADWLCAPPKPAALGVHDERRAVEVGRQLTPMPLRTHQERLVFDDEILHSNRHVFVRCTDGSDAVEASYGRATEWGFAVEEIETGHCPQLTAARATADLLIKIAT